MRRKTTEPHLEDGGIYRMRWWAKVSCTANFQIGWTLRNSSGVSEGVDKSVEQSDGEFLSIGVWGRQ